MKKNLLYVLLGLAIFILSSYQIHGQSSPQTVALKKGQVLDVLLLSQNPNVTEDLKSYFQTAFPVAKRMSYKPMPGFKIKHHTKGNHRPSSLILGKWSDVEKRESFLTQILKEVPDFHEQRRKIWSYFGLSYFVIQEDLTFNIDREKYHIATAYWLKTNDESDAFLQKWKKQLDKNSGSILIQLQNGTSPFGYRYDPNYFVISSWENESAYKAFQEKTQLLNIDNIEHVNEFVLE